MSLRFVLLLLALCVLACIVLLFRARGGRRVPAPAERGLSSAALEQGYVAMYVTARGEACFDGARLRRIFELCRLRPGAMQIYHYHADPLDEEEPLFSVADMFEPGVLREQDLEHLSTRGLVFFLRPRGLHDADRALRTMRVIAAKVAEFLQAEISETPPAASGKHGPAPP